MAAPVVMRRLPTRIESSRAPFAPVAAHRRAVFAEMANPSAAAADTMEISGTSASSRSAMVTWAEFGEDVRFWAMPQQAE